jgi:hypothetical protein
MELGNSAFSNYSESETQLVFTSGMVQYIFPKRAIEQSKFAKLTELVKSKIALQVNLK